MKRTNTFEVHSLSESDEALLQDVMDATASFWNELTYARRQRFFDDENIWETNEFREQYKAQLGAAGVETVARKNTMTSVYVRDPDGNLVEIAAYDRD